MNLSVDEKDASFTDPEEAEEFVKRTGVDALAVSIGTAHGVYKGEPKLDFDRLKEIKERIKIPVVLHGASGIPEADLKKAVSLGVCKVNVNTDFQQAYAAKVREVLANDPEVFDPRKICGPGREAIKAAVIEKIMFLGSNGRV